MSGTNKITTGEALRKTKIYIDGRKAGLMKSKAAELAGFSENVQRVPKIIEKSNAYALNIKAMSEQNAMSLYKLANKISKAVHNDESPAKILLNTQIMKNIAHIEDMLTPKVTLKETTDKNGNKVRSTQWGSAGVFKSTED